MMSLILLAKKNQDGSFSVSMRAGDLVNHAFVDFYDDISGNGYQRSEPQRSKRGRDIAEYMERCVQERLPPRLFEMTANARSNQLKRYINFDPLDENHNLGLLCINPQNDRWLSIIDGGTRLLGIENALAQSVIDENLTFDLRLFDGLSLAEEIAQFLLINEKQKRVRTDLSLRVVQRKLDDDELSEEEKRVLQTVVPESDSWKFEASRIAGIMNQRPDSPWKGLIQMPNDKVTRPVKLQAFFTSLKPILTEPDLDGQFERIRKQQKTQKTEVIVRVLINFWNAVRRANPQAYEEPQTNVLWGSIGVNSCHIALAPIILSLLRNNEPDLTEERFYRIVKDTLIADYQRWYSTPGSKPAETYPVKKGDMPRMTGAANYVRQAKELENEWRAAIHSDTHTGNVKL